MNLLGRLGLGSRSTTRRVFLHIGAMKTGTTFLQNLMAANKAGLAEAGVVFPGEFWIEQDRAARDVLGFVSDPHFAAQSAGMWDRITAEMLAPGVGTAVFSMEFLSYADPEKAARVVESFPDCEVHVILTVRDAAKTFPAQWQTQCANMGRVSWPRFLQNARQVIETGDAEKGAARKFMRTQGIPRMLDVWAPLVEPGRLHVVTVPPSGSDPMLLWERFAGVVGVDPGACSILPEHVNTSVGYASAELLRRVNTGLGDVRRSDYDRVVKVKLARDTLGPRASTEQRIRLHRPGLNLAAKWNRRVRQAIEAHGAELVGSLDDLPVQRAGPEAPAEIERPDPAELLAAAAAAHDELVTLRRSLRRTLGHDQTEAEGAAEPQSDPSAAVKDVTALVQDCIALVQEKRTRETLTAG